MAAVQKTTLLLKNVGTAYMQLCSTDHQEEKSCSLLFDKMVTTCSITWPPVIEKTGNRLLKILKSYPHIWKINGSPDLIVEKSKSARVA